MDLEPLTRRKRTKSTRRQANAPANRNHVMLSLPYTPKPIERKPITYARIVKTIPTMGSGKLCVAKMDWIDSVG